MSPRLSRRFAALACAFALVCAVPATVNAAPRHSGARASLPTKQSDGRVSLPGSVGPASLLRRATPIGRVPAAQTVTAALSLPWRSPAALQTLIGRQANPHDALYKHWLSPAEFNSRFAPSQADYDAVKAWARQSGLTVGSDVPSRNLIFVSGKRDAIENAFAVRLGSYRMSNGRVAMRPLSLPRLPAGIAGRISGVSGLDTLALRRPFLRRPAARSSFLRPSIFNGNGPGGGLIPSDIKTLYALDGTDVGDGTGQTIALYELDGYVSSDITTYAAAYGLGTPSITNVFLNGFNGLPSSGISSAEPEVVLDIEMALALAPKARIIVYEADNSTAGSLAILQRIATENTASVVSISYGISETVISTSERTTEDAIFQQMSTQGQCVYVSAGDNGAYQETDIDATTGAGIYSVAVSDPASQPNVVAVGGTSLLGTNDPVTDTTTGVTTYPISYLGETTWNSFPTNAVPTDATVLLYGATGGGISTVWPKPSYQTGVGASLAAGGTGMRDLPDVSLNSDPNTGYTVYLTDYSEVTTSNPIPPVGYGIFGGTSAAAPLWAAFNALINERRASFRLGRLGFANPDIYTLAEGSTYAANFHDIADGSTNLVYAAKAGFDDATGWGTFKGGSLLASLAPTASTPFDLQGTVTDTNGQAITDAVVTITTPQITTFSVSQTTDGSTDGTTAGSYTQTLNSLLQATPTSTPAAIKYTVSVDAPGFAGQTINNVTVPATLNFVLRAPDHVFTNPGTLQMISAPYDYTAAGDFPTLFGLSATDLVKSTDNPTPPVLITYAPNLTRYLLYPSAPADTFHRGQGYWARLGTDGTVRRSGAAITAGQAFRINLLAGWNQIGDPFPTAVSLSSLQVESTTSSGTTVGISSSVDIILPLYSYTGTTTSPYAQVGASGTLQPWVGYWIYAKNAVTLVVPPPGG